MYTYTCSITIMLIEVHLVRSDVTDRACITNIPVTHGNPLHVCSAIYEYPWCPWLPNLFML